MANDIIMETRNLDKYFKVKGKMLHAVDDINLKIKRGKTLGVVGESGCGKSTLGRTVIGLLPATSGEILFEGEDITKYNRRKLKALRREVQIMFQDPYSSLNPRHSVGDIIGEALLVNGIIKNRAEREERVFELMETVGLEERFFNSYPHEFDGGRRQRIGIARALSLNPKFIVCDEPVSALDVSIQAQVLNLLMDLQEELDLTYMFITHDLSVVRHISDEIMVMYMGQCVERAEASKLFSNPLHPYTKALFAAIPTPTKDAKIRKPELLKGEVASAIEPEPGCRFASRCKYVTSNCIGEDIKLKEVEVDHFVACTLYEK